jgi:hypothetical protein
MTTLPQLRLAPWWAWSICHAGQRLVCPDIAIDPGQRGAVFMVALRSADAVGYAAALDRVRRRPRGGVPMPPLRDLPQCCIVAVAWVVEAVADEHAMAQVAACDPDARRWWTRGPGYVLAPEVGVFRVPVRLPEASTEAA